MEQLIPSKILDSLVCQNCFSYLTVLPICVLPNGYKLCGRCLPKKYPKTSKKPFCLLENFGFDAVYNIPVALLGYMSYLSSFPCINKYEGCRETLKLEDVEAHEENCVFKKVQCPLCRFSGVGSQLVNHFKCFHKKYFSREARLVLKTCNNFQDTALCDFFNYLLFVTIEFQKQDRTISLRFTCISDVNCFAFAKLFLRFACRGAKEFGQLEVMSEKLFLVKGDSFEIAIQVEDFHFVESDSVECLFKMLFVQ